MSKIKITIFGEGIKIKRLYLPDHIIFDWKEKTGLKQIDLSDKIIDSFFFHDLKHTHSINHWTIFPLKYFWNAG